jgi:hypothetical protein
MQETQMIRFLARLAISSLAVTTALAQPSMPDHGDARFSFHRADDGYLRLDGKTGQVSLCNRRSAGWQCQAVPDERSALEAEIARLQGENAALKKELLGRNMPLPNGVRPQPPASIPDTPAPKRFGEAQVDKLMRFVDRVWRRLVDMVESVQREIFRRT